MRHTGICAITWLAFVILTGPAFAHKVVVFAWVEGDTVRTEAGFGGKRPAKDCEIMAFDSGGTLVFQGRTDGAGRSSFKVPQGHAGDMRLELSAGPGHKGTWTIRAEEFGPPAPDGVSAKDASKTRGEVLDRGPDPVKILAGIGVIFGLAIGARLVMKGRSSDGNSV